MRFYFDTSALVKRATKEKESEAMREFFSWIVDRGDNCVTSKLGRIELARVVRRQLSNNRSEVNSVMRKALDNVSLYPINDAVATLAEEVGQPPLRSLDALHLATALTCGANAVVTYDERMRRAAFDEGILVIQPGGQIRLPDSWGWVPGSAALDSPHDKATV